MTQRMDSPTDPFQKINHPNIVEDIIKTFQQAIIAGDLQPGQRLPSEVELGEQLGVGRGTLREAMKKLEALGVVVIKRGDGTYIIDKPSQSLLNPMVFAIMLEAETGIELLELRSLIQVGYCQLAAQKAREEDWSRIEAAQEAFENYSHFPQRDVDRLTQLDLDFHKAILKATHNPLVIKIGRTVEELFFASIRNTLAKMDGLDWGIEGHQNIIQSLRECNPEMIRRAVQESLTHWGKEVGAEE